MVESDDLGFIDMNPSYASQKLAHERHVEIESMKLKQEVVVTPGVCVLNRIIIMQKGKFVFFIDFHCLLSSPIPIPNVKGNANIERNDERGGVEHMVGRIHYVQQQLIKEQKRLQEESTLFLICRHVHLF